MVITNIPNLTNVTTRKSDKTTYIFQQDGATTCMANVVQSGWKATCFFLAKDLLASRALTSTHWTSLSGGTLRARSVASCHASVAALKSSIDEVWKIMSAVYISTVCKAFRCRLEAILEAKGGQIHK